MIFYSSSKNCFYDSNIHDSNVLPFDVIEITKELHESLLKGNSEGMTISSDKNGNPILVKNTEYISYSHLRQSEYPPMTDYLDAVVKGDQVAIQAYIDTCNAVKAKYPKPTVV